MKSSRVFLTLLATAAFILAGCDFIQQQTSADEFELNKTELKFNADKEEADVTLIASSSWTAEITEGEKWLKADPMQGEGSAEKQTITVSVSRNKDTDNRNGEITFTMKGGRKLTLEVTQKGFEEADLSLSSKSLEFDYKSSTQSVKLNANQEWSVSIDNEADWVVVTPENGEGKDEAQEIEISVVTNNRGSRLAEITFTCGSESKTLEIYQSSPLKPGEYFIGAFADNRYSIAKGFLAQYGYLQDDTSLINNGFLGYADNVFTFKCTEEGYTIQDSYGMYYSCSDGYSDFTRTDQIPDAGGIWTITPNEDGTYIVTDDKLGYSIQYMESVARYGVLRPGQTNGRYVTITKAETVEERPMEEYDISEIIAGADKSFYKCTGYVSSITNTTYGNFYLRDYSGELYVYGTLDAEGRTKNFLSLGIENGDIVTVSGPKLTYGGITELVDVTVENIIKVTDVSIQDFLAAEVSDKYYRLTGTINNIENTTYGNFYITDYSGASVYVYGLLSGWNGPQKQFAELNLKEGDEVTLVGNRYAYGTKDEVTNAFYVSHISK